MKALWLSSLIAFWTLVLCRFIGWLLRHRDGKTADALIRFMFGGDTLR